MTSHLYSTLSPPERLVLLIEAMARRDGAEADRLRDACPRRHYEGPDLQSLDRAHVAFDTAAVVSCDLMRFHGMLKALTWTQEVLTLVPQGRKTNVIATLTRRSAQEAAKDLAVGWLAFDRFCRTRPGVEPDALLSAWRLPGAWCSVSTPSPCTRVRYCA